jgi:hypothetical protein
VNDDGVHRVMNVICVCVQLQRYKRKGSICQISRGGAGLEERCRAPLSYIWAGKCQPPLKSAWEPLTIGG